MDTWEATGYDMKKYMGDMELEPQTKTASRYYTSQQYTR